MLFADIFQWDVDLFVDPRPGDRVRVVYETRSLAPPADDLPPFGDGGMDEGSYLGIGRVLAASYEGLRASSSAFWVEDDGRGGDYYDAEGAPLRKAFLKSPLNYRRISSGFTNRRRHPITRRVVPHHGVDFVAAAGTPVVAAADGRVISAGWDGALGKAVRLRHGNGYRTIYGHLRAFARGIRRGAPVEQNQVIGYVGATGRATGPHLHYTMLYNRRAINPLTFDNPPVAPLDESYTPVLDRARLTWAPVLLAIRVDGSEVGIARNADPAGRAGPG
jgi:murein DD-endopeptidase MepM/ murein hydrolase activator NlpD